jgi:hypothetical protein
LLTIADQSHLGRTLPCALGNARHTLGSHQIIVAEKLYPLCRAKSDSAIHIIGLLQEFLASVYLDAGVSVSVLLANIYGPVCRGVVGDYDLEMGKGLRLNAVQRFAQIICTVVNRQGD